MTPDPLTSAREALAAFDAPRCGAEIHSWSLDEPQLSCCDLPAGHDGAHDRDSWSVGDAMGHLRAALAEADRLRARLASPTDAERARLLHVAAEAADDPNPRPALAYRLANALPRLLAALTAAEGERDELQRAAETAAAAENENARDLAAALDRVRELEAEVAALRGGGQ